MKLDDVRIGVRSGDGIVARLPDAVLVVPFAGEVDHASVDRLLEACRNGPVAGRLEELRAAADAGVPTFAVVAEVGDSFGVYAEGDAAIGIAGGEPLLASPGAGSTGGACGCPTGSGRSRSATSTAARLIRGSTSGSASCPAPAWSCRPWQQ